MLSSFALIICLISVMHCFTFEYGGKDVEKSEKLCLNPPALCTCVVIYLATLANYVYSCSHDESKEKIVFYMGFYDDDWISFLEMNVSSFQIIPDMTNYINSTGIHFNQCVVPENESLYLLTNKISKNVKHLSFGSLQPKNLPLDVDKHLFDGLSQLESLQINTLFNIYLKNNIFERLANLKKLILTDPRTLKISFATLNQLQVLSIENNKVELEVGAFKNQINLVELSLRCSIESFLYSQIFANLTNLEILKITGPFMIIWPDHMFRHNRKLKSIQLNFIRKRKTSPMLSHLINLKGGTIHFSNIEDLSEDVFKTLINLEELILTENMLKSLPKDVFVDQIRLELLDLSFNNLRELPDELFDTTLNMRILMISNNKLKNISRHLFAKLVKLEKLLLDQNKLMTIDESFSNLVNLREINLSFNQLSRNQTNKLFDRLSKMEKLYLNNNQLEEFLISDKSNFGNLQMIDLSHNKITTFNYSDWMVYQMNTKMKIYLSHNRITQFKIDDFLHLADIISEANSQKEPNLWLIINNNPVICDCNAIKLVRFVKQQIEPRIIYNIIDFISNNFTCQEPKQLLNRLVSRLNTSELVCNIKTDCPEGCRCDQRSVDETLVFNCSFSNFQQFPTLPKYANLNLTKTELHAANNKIQSIQLTNIPDDLALLDLRNNSLDYLEENVITRFESIAKLYLSQNPWICNCKGVKFINFYQIFRSNIADADEMICSDGRPFKELNPKNVCIQLIEILVIFLLLVSLFALSIAFYVVNKKKIKMWLYAHNFCLWWVSEEEVDKDKIYDAFFIFSHFDDNFVTDMILDLELKSFKCCVHHRDWPAGEMIVTLSLASIRTSRRIIVVLSPMFIQSNWATWEFRVALIHAFKERRSRVLIIIYGDPSLIEDLDEDLKTYVKFNNYLDSEDAWFEEKLLYAMPHKADQDKIEKDKKKNKKNKNKRILTSSEVLNAEIQGIDLEMRNLSESE